MDTTSDLTFRIDGEELTDITLARGDSVDFQTRVDGGAGERADFLDANEYPILFIPEAFAFGSSEHTYAISMGQSDGDPIDVFDVDQGSQIRPYAVWGP